MENLPIGIAQVALDGRFLHADAGFSEILGYPSDELLTHTLEHVTHPTDWPEHAALQGRVAAGELASYSKPIRFVSRNGSTIQTRVTVAGTRDPTGGVVGFMVVVAEPRSGGTGLDEARLRAALDASPLGIDVMDLEGNPVFYNPKAQELHGISLEQAGGRGWTEAVHPDDRERVARSWYEAARSGSPWAETYRFVHPNGRVVWVSGRAAPMTVDGKIVGYVGTLEDITPLKITEKALKESEERFRTLGNSIPQLVWMADSAGTIVWYNDRWSEYTGVPLGRRAEEDWRNVLHPEHANRVLEGIRRAFATGESWEDTFPLRSRTGEYRWFLSRMVRTGDPDGSEGWWFGTNTDVTERIEAAAERDRILEREREARGEAERRAREEEALREAAGAVAASSTTREAFPTIARSALTATNADGALVERIDFQSGEVSVVAAAGEAAPTTGSRTPYVGSLARRVVEGAKPEIVDRLAESRLRLSSVLVRLHPDHSAIAVPLMGGGEPIGALILLRAPGKPRFREDEIRRAGTFADLAALAFRRIQLLEASERRREELEQVMESRARLMWGFSHDVKNPLGAADGFLALLEDGILGEISEQQKENVKRARRALGRSLELIDDLLELARAEAGQIEVRWAPVDLRDAVRELGEEYRAQAEAKGLAMEIELPEDLPAIESDASRLRQILGNLFSNAVKYTDEGIVRLAVELRSRGDTPWIATKVSDTGSGIPTEKQRLLFQEFTRLDPGEKKGAGVGLAISQRIAHLLGGEITATSEAGRGSTFTLWLPCARTAAAAANGKPWDSAGAAG